MHCLSVLPEMLKRLGKVEAGPERRRLLLHPRHKEVAQFLPLYHLLKSFADPCSGSLILRVGVEFLMEDAVFCRACQGRSASPAVPDANGVTLGIR
jgi:hypothetical protein